MLDIVSKLMPPPEAVADDVAKVPGIGRRCFAALDEHSAAFERLSQAIEAGRWPEAIEAARVTAEALAQLRRLADLDPDVSGSAAIELAERHHMGLAYWLMSHQLAHYGTDVLVQVDRIMVRPHERQLARVIAIVLGAMASSEPA